MPKAIVKKIFTLVGADLKRYNKEIGKYEKLFEKFKKYTMIPKEIFALNLDLCHVNKNISGDYVECGIWRGGMSAAVAEIIGKERHFHLFDSFEGLPPAKEIDGKDALTWQKDTSSPNYYDNCSAEEKFAIEAMKLANHKNYKLYKGWFDKTIPGSINKPIAILRLDGDWYDSTITCLDELFPKVVEGGIIILDDYYTWDGCARAVHDYLSKVKSPARVHQWHNRIAYIIKKS